MFRTATTLPYEAARLPLAVIDRGLAARLPEASRPRLAVGRTIGSIDRLAGAILRDVDLTSRGDDRIRRVDALIEAERLGARAASRREAAQDVEASGREQAAEERRAANERAAASLDEADRAEVKGKQHAAAEAKKTAAAKKRAANRTAAQRTDTVDKRKEAVAERAETKKKAARQRASSQLADARDSEEAAAGERDGAALLEDLTEHKKAARKKS